MNPLQEEPPIPNYSGMTKRQITDAIRKEWMKDRKKFAAIQKQAERTLLPNGRWKTLIRCACCNDLFDRQQIEANHITPVGKLETTAPIDIGAYRRRMFVPVQGIEALCKLCHRAKTAQQRKQTQTH